jgi:two-component system invasion response regulator UvrY
MLSIHSEEVYAIKALKYGASGYLTKSSAPEELISAIHKVSLGGRYISASLAEKMAETLLSESDQPLRQILSSREIEVLDLFSKGKSVALIATELSLSPKTISTYRGRLLDKLKLSTTADLIRYSILENIKEEK